MCLLIHLSAKNFPDKVFEPALGVSASRLQRDADDLPKRESPEDTEKQLETLQHNSKLQNAATFRINHRKKENLVCCELFLRTEFLG